VSVKKRDNLSISPWIGRFSALIGQAGTVLDLAAGGGRHSLWLLDQGFSVTAVDRDIEALTALKAADPRRAERLEIIQADLEDGSPWPLAKRRFDALVVVNYLWRPLFPDILAAIDAEGILLYETFAAGQEALGRPANPDFLLEPGELLEVVAGHLAVVAYEHGRMTGERGPAIKQRIAASGRAGALPLPHA
jgi:SAM-dependent methyltransferase